MNILRRDSNENPSPNIDRFIVETGKVIPLDRPARERLKSHLLDIPKKNTVLKGNGWLLFWPMADNIPRLGPPTDEALSEGLIKNMSAVRSAYHYLCEIQKVEEEWLAYGASIESPVWIEQLYDYFDI